MVKLLKFIGVIFIRHGPSRKYPANCLEPYPTVLPVPNSISMAIYFALGELPGNNTPTLSAASPVSYITPDDPPFLIIHGEKDDLAPLEQAQMLDAKLKDASVSSKLVIVKNGEHGLMSLKGDPTVPSQAEISQTILDFLNTNLMQ